MNIHNSIIIILLITIIFSCKKKDDTIIPVVTISSPIKNQEFAFGETINVIASCSDDKNLATVSVSLYDESYNLVGKPKIFHPNSTSYNVDTDIKLDVPGIVTGKHFIQVSANDDFQTKKAFVEVIINGQQFEQKAVLVLSNSGSSCQVYSLDANLELQLEFNHTKNILDAILNSSTQQISLLSTSGNLSTYNLSNYSIAWTEDNINDFQSNFKSTMNIYDNLNFVSYRNGNIFAFDGNGVVRQSATISEANYYPTEFSKHNDYLIVALENDISLPNKVEKTYYSTGVPLINFEIDMDITDIFSYDSDRVIIWGNKNNVAKVCTLSTQNNVLYELSNIPSGKLNAVEQIDASTFILCIGNDIKTFNTYNDLFSDYKLGVRADIIKYNDYEGYLYLVDNNKLLIYSYSLGSLIKEITHLNTINDIEFWFNK